MKKHDLLTMCLQNLFRHRARTLLTVLGVVVGCCSIIIMVSIGVGMKEAQEKMLSEMGDLTIITVTPGGKGANAAKLDDAMVKKIRKLEHVTVVTPRLSAENVTVQLYANNRRYLYTYPEIVGIDPNAVDKLGYRMVEGASLGKAPFSVLVGEEFAYAFSDTKRPEGHNTVDFYGAYFGGMGDMGGDGFSEGGVNAAAPKKPEPYFDPLKSKLELEIEVGGSDSKKIAQKLVPVGRMKADNGKGYETSQGLVMRLQDLQQILEQERKAAGRKAPANKGYKTVIVKVASIQDVEKIENEIKALGFRTNSMESIRKPMEKEARQKQMMLGGLGAISLLVAALGITNTMIMSISERTREIGIMKSLGCFVRDVRAVFLMEAGCIGLMGGFVGVIISLLTSLIMNLASNKAAIVSFSSIWTVLTTKGSRMSVIPPWLILFALLFSILIGVGSGYYPANKAVQISALEAIKHD